MKARGLRWAGDPSTMVGGDAPSWLATHHWKSTLEAPPPWSGQKEPKLIISQNKFDYK